MLPAHPIGHSYSVGNRVGETYRFREYSLVPDQEPDAEPTMYAVQCCVCEKRSEYTEKPPHAASWALGHIKTTREHFTYRLLRTVPFRAEPGAWL